MEIPARFSYALDDRLISDACDELLDVYKRMVCGAMSPHYSVDFPLAPFSVNPPKDSLEGEITDFGLTGAVWWVLAVRPVIAH